MRRWLGQGCSSAFLLVTLTVLVEAEPLLLATIAHELHHAVEIIRDPTVVDRASTLALYRQIGTGDCREGLTDACETDEALKVEARVLDELDGFGRDDTACSRPDRSAREHSASTHRDSTLVLQNLTIIDGNGGLPLTQRTLVIRAGRIVQIAAAPDDVSEPGAEYLDLRGHYAIPGLVDSHVHLSLIADDPVAALRAAFYGGVTAVRDMGGDEGVVRRLAERRWRIDIPEPRVYFATAVRGSVASDTVPGRRMSLRHRPALPLWLKTIVEEESQIESIIERAKESGASGIKLYSDLPLHLLKMLGERAKRAGLRVWGHARIFPHRPSQSLEAGVEVLSHGSQLAFEETNGPDDGDVYRLVGPDSTAVTTLLRAMQVRGVMLEPTLRASSVARPGKVDLSRLDSVPALAWACRVTRRAHELGVAVVAGTDRLNDRDSGRSPNIHTELELLVLHGGLTPVEAIGAATRTAARMLGNDDVFGTIAVGKWADLVILRSDPSRDIRNTRTIALVIKAGVVHRVDERSLERHAGGQ